MFKVEVFLENEWDVYSWHQNKDNAVDMGSVYCKSRCCIGRIIHEGAIINTITEKGVIN